jgi:hypothetical protein
VNSDVAQDFDAIESEPIGLAGLAPVGTLGQKLAAQAQQMAARRMPAQPWLHALAPLLGRLAALPAPDAARFQRVELGSEPLPLSPRVRPSREDAATEALGSMAGVDKSSGLAPIDARALLAPDVGVRDSIHSGSSSSDGPGGEIVRDFDPRAVEAPASSSARVRDTIQPDVRSLAGLGAAPASDLGAHAEEASLAPDTGASDMIRPSVSSVGGPGVPPAGDIDPRAVEASAPPSARTRDTIRPNLNSLAGLGAPRAEEASLAPHAGASAMIRPSVGSVGEPGVQPAGDIDPRAAQAPVSPSVRIRDMMRPGVSSSSESSVEAPRDRDAQPEGLPVSPEVRVRLRDLAGPALATMRVRDDVQADAVARSRQADAVTVGNQVLFRADRYRPHTPQGLALLAHEATHVAQAQQPNVAWQRATTAGRAAEERQALAVERATLRSAQGTSPGAALGAASPLGGVPGQTAAPSQAAWSLPALPAAAGAGSTAAMQPMAAATGRDLEAQPAPSTPAPSFQELREALVRDLMRQLRADFERGG